MGKRWQGAIAFGAAATIAAWAGVGGAIEPGEYQGTLDGTEATLANGNFYDVIELDLVAGESVSITLTSDDFDTFLAFRNREGDFFTYASDANRFNSQVITIIPKTTTYYILVTSRAPQTTGKYHLIWQVATATEITQSERRQEADHILQQGIQQLNTGEPREALKSWEQSLALYHAIGDQSGERISLNNLGIAYTNLSQYNRAIAIHKQSLFIAREIGDHRGEAHSLNGLGNAYRFLSQYSHAINFHQQSLSIARKIGDLQAEANALGNLGSIYNLLSQYENAIHFHQQSLSLARRLGDYYGEMIVLDSLGSDYRSLGEYERAIDFYEQSLAISNRIDDEEGKATALGNLGSVYSLLGQFEDAIILLQQQLNIAQKIDDRQNVAASFGNLGNVHLSAGHYEDAIGFFKQQLEITRSISDRHGEAIALNNLGITYAFIDQPQISEFFLIQGLDVLETIRHDLGNNDARKISFFEEQLIAYHNIEIILAATDRAEAALEIADRARARSLAEFLAADQPNAPTSLDLDGIRQVIREQNATAIVYSDLGGILYTWVVRPDGHITLRHEQSADETVYDTMLHARSSATNPHADGRGAAASDLGQWSANLRSTIARDRAVVSLSRDDLSNTGETGLGDAYQRLIAPIADLLPTDPGARLIIVPDRELGLIPWAALRDPASDRRLIDRYTLTLAPSLQTLRETHRRRQNLPPGGPPLIVGNPDPMPNGLDPLPHAEREASAIAQRHHITPLVGAAATETAVKQTWQTARWLHFATHGDPGWIALRRDRTNDGLLTSEEIFNSHLQAELVVMSACDTGRGNVTGEGILSLARAFLRAGTPSVIATLWQVPDDATAFLMDIFYRELAAGASKATALRTAQLETRAQPQYAHPRNWAAFILIGEAN